NHHWGAGRGRGCLFLWSLVQAALSQPSSLSANVGDTVRITCSGLSSNYGSGWSQQKVPGTAPVALIYPNDKRPSGIPSRFSGSRSGSTGTLTITGVQAEDEAVYFCGRVLGDREFPVVQPLLLWAGTARDSPNICALSTELG
uniref:Ig-like domain-containing protein n=1 Tax=Malurus cyaneus samueli TaxID=2593467 RepID=A0A8C5TGL5_9PASS